MTGGELGDIRKAIGASQTKFGLTLARLIDPKAGAFSRQYISGLEHGRFGITAAIERAALALGAELDGTHPLLARARPVTVLSPNGLESGAIVLGHARPCARIGCQVRFVPHSPRQMYCHVSCRKAARRI